MGKLNWKEVVVLDLLNILGFEIITYVLKLPTYIQYIFNFFFILWPTPVENRIQDRRHSNRMH